jgi:hypothetical protein
MQRAAVLLMLAVACLIPGNAHAATELPGGQREIIPGSELMSSQERERYRQRMRGAGSVEERSKIREEHLKEMRDRARLRGLRLAEPTPPPAP